MWAVPAQSHASSKYQRFLDTEVKKIVRSPSARAGLEAVANRNFDGGMAEWSSHVRKVVGLFFLRKLIPGLHFQALRQEHAITDCWKWKAGKVHKINHPLAARPTSESHNLPANYALWQVSKQAVAWTLIPILTVRKENWWLTFALQPHMLPLTKFGGEMQWTITAKKGVTGSQ
jgi:hypothetical protein